MSVDDTHLRIEAHRSLAATDVFEVVRRNGEEELARPIVSLFWSGVAAGIAMGFSVVTEAAILSHLPDTGWAILIGDLGYTIGFILVVLGGLQLFTETTITPVLPICHRPTNKAFRRLGRLWSVVLGANLVGASLFGVFIMASGAVGPEIEQGIVELGRHAADGGVLETIAAAVPAGFLVAAMVWALAATSGRDILIVLVVTYAIGVAGFAHVIAGSVEMAALVTVGALGVLDALLGFLAPALIGNVIGGSALFTLLAYAQIRAEVDS